jgi:aminomuconate-semialdehyde/2-hydroxymuconate-6-semialdehyde dehydrogenase
MEKIKNYINGELREADGGAWIDNYEPATGAVYSLIPDSGGQDVQSAVEAATAAFPAWSATPAKKRSAILLRIADLIERDMERLALAESRDNGKPVWLAKSVDIPRASANFRFYATGALHMASKAHLMEGSALNYTVKSPIGIAGCISPWNLPLYLFTWKVAPALAAGNCVVAKPSEITPMTAFMLSELCIEAGLPKGVLNIVHGYGHKVGAAIAAHPDIPVISFTGGTKTGAEISRVAAPMFKKLSLELGGKNPNLIFADCNLEKAVQTSIRSSFANQGEICLCGSRIFVERPLYDTFKSAFLAAVKAQVTGDPQQESSRLGAIVSEQHMEKILSYIELARQEGGTVLHGGNRVNPGGRCSGGWFIEPTVIEGLPFNCRTNQEEIFGPVVTLMPFDTEEEVLAFANSTRYGLSATVWTENLSRAHRVSHLLHAGIVWVNTWLLRDLRTPFGGVKDSGVGREGGFEALDFFTEEKNVCIKL